MLLMTMQHPLTFLSYILVTVDLMIKNSSLDIFYFCLIYNDLRNSKIVLISILNKALQVTTYWFKFWTKIVN